MARIVINKDLCKSCKICMNACPKNLIKTSACTNSIGVHYAEFKDEQKECLGCALCAESCPEAAIVEVYR